MDEEDEILYQTPSTVTITQGAYNSIADQSAHAERQAILRWLTDSRQPHTHVCWQLARDISNGEHLK